MNNLNNSELALNDFVVNNINNVYKNVYPVLTINDKTENKPSFNTVFGEWGLVLSKDSDCEKYLDLSFSLNKEELPWSREILALLKDENNRVLNIKVSTNADNTYYNNITDDELTFEWKQPIINSSEFTIKYGLEKSLNISVKEKSACKIDPVEYLVDEYFTFTADNVLPKGLSLAEDGTITGTIEEEFDPWGFNTTDVIVSYPGAEDEEITITWEYVEPEIIADSSKSINGKVNEELNTFNYTPEIGPSEFYTDKTKFTYSVGDLPRGVSASNNNGKLVISGTPEEEFDETTTVTISYPNAEDEKLSIKWNIELECPNLDDCDVITCPDCDKEYCKTHDVHTCECPYGADCVRDTCEECGCQFCTIHTDVDNCDVCDALLCPACAENHECAECPDRDDCVKVTCPDCGEEYCQMHKSGCPTCECPDSDDCVMTTCPDCGAEYCQTHDTHTCETATCESVDGCTNIAVNKCNHCRKTFM